jgi:ABC-type multidrug transport system permease subunit
MGILFQSGFFIALGAMQRVPPQLDVRPTFYKQQDANFYPTGTFVLARSIAGIPSSLIDALVYGTIVYWFVGLAFNDGASIANFFIFLLIVLIAAFSSGMMFGILSGACPDRSTAQASMSVALIIMVLFSGFTVQPDVIPE